MPLARKEVSTQVVKDLCDPSLFLGTRNANPTSATSAVESIFERFDTESEGKLRDFVDSPEERGNTIDEIYEILTEKAKTNPHAKTFLEFWDAKDVEIAHVDDFVMLVLQCMDETRESADTIRKKLNISQSDIMKMLMKMTDPTVRHKLLAGHLDNTVQHPPKGGDPGRSHEKAKTGTKKGGDSVS